MKVEGIILERSIDPPAQLADLAAGHQQLSWCMDQYRAQHVLSALAHDGGRAICQFRAPDTEAVRNVMRQAGVPYERLWRASVHGPQELALTAPVEVTQTLVVTERSSLQPTDLATIGELGARAARHPEQHGVRLLRSYLAAGDQQRIVCLYDAPDAEAVRAAQRQAGLPADRVWPAYLFSS